MTEPQIWTDDEGNEARVWFFPDAKPLLESLEAIEALTGTPLLKNQAVDASE